jgi:hypothetical protein
MKIQIKGRETMLLTPGEIYDMPDNIALQLLKRGKAVELKNEVEPKKKVKKE